MLDHPEHADDEGASVPLVSKAAQDEGEEIYGGDEAERREGAGGAIVPYAHRDLKPG